MDLPTNLYGWANLLAYFWAVVAYAVAALAGVRALNVAYDKVPALPSCIVVDATRWVFGLGMSDRKWRPRDFIALGVLGTCCGSVLGFLQMLQFLIASSWLKLGYATSLEQAGPHVLLGSALIVLHCGTALRFEKEGDDG